MERTVILYDADCAFCRWWTARIMTWDHHDRLRPVALQDPAAERLLPGMKPEDRMRSWHLVKPDGRIYSAGAAVPPLMRLLPGGRPLAALASTFPGATERLYQWVSDHRDRLRVRRP
ncbi:MAG: DUF393 domain-containing protein [Actinobacteria bacterium]|nr:DUF393 domain-containing protein [Actinomycetota bacterium]